MLRFFGGNHHIIKNVAVLVKICEVVVNVFEIAQLAFTIVLVLPAHKPPSLLQLALSDRLVFHVKLEYGSIRVRRKYKNMQVVQQVTRINVTLFNWMVYTKKIKANCRPGPFSERLRKCVSSCCCAVCMVVITYIM